MTNLVDYFSLSKLRQSKRVGRGIAAGGGKSAGRGTKGQKSRSGANRKIPHWFEGGQTPFYQKIAKKRGFSRTKTPTLTFTSRIVNTHFKSGETVSPETMMEKGLIRKNQSNYKVKIINKGGIKENIKFENIFLSKSLKEPNTNG